MLYFAIFLKLFLLFTSFYRKVNSTNLNYRVILLLKVNDWSIKNNLNFKNSIINQDLIDLENVFLRNSMIVLKENEVTYFLMK